MHRRMTNDFRRHRRDVIYWLIITRSFLQPLSFSLSPPRSLCPLRFSVLAARRRSLFRGGFNRRADVRIGRSYLVEMSRPA